MSFIAQNYVWFIVAAVLILMAVIGYIAEKTDYASKKIGDKNNSKKEENTLENVPVQNNEPNVEVSSNINDTNNIQTPINVNNGYNYDNLNIGLMDSINKINENDKQKVDDNSTSNNPLNPVENNTVPASNDVNNMEDLYAPLPTQKENKEVETTENVSIDNQVETEETNNEVAKVDGLYMPPEAESSSDSTEENIYPTEDNISLTNVEPYNLELQNNDNSENIGNDDYHKLFPEDPIIIGENNKEEAAVSDDTNVWSN